jgi:acetylornithine deacetylase/succinyl-diaminopimelate desuccinylase-like protein
MTSSRKLIDSVNIERLTSLTMRLVEIPSPTGDSDSVSEFYYEYLSKMGLETELQMVKPGMPNVLGLIRGKHPGPRITLLGHLDTVPAMGHPDPYIKDGIIYGRGAADMKSGVAAQAEVARVLIENEVEFSGEVLIATQSSHEIPKGASEGLFQMINEGVLGESVICTEGSRDLLPLIAKGMCQYEIHISRPGDPIHETAAMGESNPILIANRLISLFEHHNEIWAEQSYEYIGSQTLFVGMIKGGDFYNRLCNDCRIIGTIRFGPEKDFNDIRNELEKIIHEVQETTSISIELKLNCVGLGFRISDNEPIVKALYQGYNAVTGKDISYGGMLYTADASKVIRNGNIPAVQYGAGSEYAHAELERIPISDVFMVTKIFLQTVLNFLDY